MEKLFTPGKWFVGFCAVFVLIFAIKNYVANAKLEEMGKVVASDIFDWQWADLSLTNSCDIKEARVVKADENAAVIQVKGVQTRVKGADTKDGITQVSPCQALIKLYRQDNNWWVGSVEVQ